MLNEHNIKYGYSTNQNFIVLSNFSIIHQNVSNIIIDKAI